MDRNVVIATVLIALIMVVWLTWLTPPVPPPDPLATQDSLQVVPEVELPEEPVQEDIGTEDLRSIEELAGDSTMYGVAEGEDRRITIRTDLYTAELATRGGTLTSFELTEHRNAADSSMVQLVDTSRAGALSLVFTTPSNRIYDSRSFFFDADIAVDDIEVSDSPVIIRMQTPIGGGTLVKTYTFARETYEVGLTVTVVGEPFMTSSGYEILWNGAIPFSEIDHEKGVQASGAFARSGGDVASALLTSEEYDETSLRGDVDWVAVKNKYFAAIIIPDTPGRAAELIANRAGELSDADLRVSFTASLAMRPPETADHYRLYLGPMELARIREYDLALYDMVDYGWDFFETVTRPLAKWVFVPVFNFLHLFIPNWGLVIIIFSILVKAALYPLTKKSFTSMAKMRELQPRMEAIKAKYPDAPQKQQEAMMKMYKETGVNPLGGCLPMLLQYPIIIALWQFLPQAIEIRQQGFLWAADLSAPDVILSLPFDVPLYGDFVSGFTVLMGLSMIVQMRLQGNMSANPQAKMFTYVFPVMIFVIFNKLAAGLNLYYLCYNVLSAAQQKLINKQLHDHPEQMKAAPKKQKPAGGSGKARKKRGRR